MCYLWVLFVTTSHAFNFLFTSVSLWYHCGLYRSTDLCAAVLLLSAPMCRRTCLVFVFCYAIIHTILQLSVVPAVHQMATLDGDSHATCYSPWLVSHNCLGFKQVLHSPVYPSMVYLQSPQCWGHRGDEQVLLLVLRLQPTCYSRV